MFLQQLITGLSVGSIYALMAVGYSLIYSLLNFTNFAHGASVLIGAYVGYFYISSVADNVLMAVVCSTFFGAVLAALIERIAYQPLLDKGVKRIYLLIAGLGISIIGENLIVVMIDGRFHAYKTSLSAMPVSILGASIGVVDLIILVASAIALLIVQFLIRKTRVGLAIRGAAFDLTTASIIYWNGHEIAEAAGSTWFQDYFYEDIRNNCIGYINIDSTGMRGAEKYGTDASRELSDYAYEMIRDVLDEDVDVAYLAKTGDQSFFGVGVPSIAGRISYSPEVVKQQNGATLGYWNHTCEDSIDKMDVDNLEKDNRVDLGVIYGLANATVLPYDFSKTCEDMKQKVEYLRKESGNIVDMECISANIDRLGKAVAALNEMKLKASELSEVRIRAFNDTLLRLSRAITNAFYTNAEKYDQDSYGRTILSKPLPLLFPTIKLSRLDKDTLEYRLLYTQMLRNRNRVADAVLTACEYAELFLAQK